MDYQKAWEKLKEFAKSGLNKYESVNGEDFFEGKYCAYAAIVDEMHNIEVDNKDNG